MSERRLLLLACLIALGISAVHAFDTFTWFLEVVPVLIAIPVLIATHRQFPLTPLAYRLLFLHALVLMVGGHYTYARVPAGFTVQRLFHLARNPYDGLGHFAQGFVPAVLAREVLLRKTPLRRGGWLFFLVASVCLAISAAYELFEWAVAVASGASAEDFLGTQGDPWDTQKDMALALLGAVAAQLALARVHDRQLQRIEEP